MVALALNQMTDTSSDTQYITVTLGGYAKAAMAEVIKHSDGKSLYPRYVKDGECRADHASAALGKWLKKDFGGLTAHCLRHTFRDRLRAIDCPMELIDQIGGWSSVQSIGSSYGKGYGLDKVRKWFLEAHMD